MAGILTRQRLRAWQPGGRHGRPDGGHACSRPGERGGDVGRSNLGLRRLLSLRRAFHRRVRGLVDPVRPAIAPRGGARRRRVRRQRDRACPGCARALEASPVKA